MSIFKGEVCKKSETETITRNREDRKMAKKEKAGNGNLVVDFEIERETKNTFRYAEKKNSLGIEFVMGTLYVRKEAFGEEERPEKLQITIK